MTNELYKELYLIGPHTLKRNNVTLARANRGLSQIKNNGKRLEITEVQEYPL